jgi:hypothetical protein
MDMFRDASRTSDAVSDANTKAANSALQLASAAARGGNALGSLPSIIQQIIAAASASSAASGGGGFGGLLSSFMSGGTGGFTAAFSQTSLGSSGFGSGLAYGNQDLGLFFSDGGYTGKGDPKKAAGIVHGEEYVFSAPAVKAIGLERLERLHQKAKSGRMDDEGVPGYSDGGYVTTRPMTWQSAVPNRLTLPQEEKTGDTYVTNHTHNVTVQAAPGMSRSTATQLGAAAVQGGIDAARRNGKRA